MEAIMTHLAKLFKNGRSQAVRLPVEFRFANNRLHGLADLAAELVRHSLGQEPSFRPLSHGRESEVI